MTHYRFVAEVIFKKNINHCYLNFCASTSQPQNVLNLSLIFYQFQSYCSYKVSSSVKKRLIPWILVISRIRYAIGTFLQSCAKNIGKIAQVKKKL